MVPAERTAYLRHLHAFNAQTKRLGCPRGAIDGDGLAVIRTLFHLQRPDGTLCPAKADIARAADLGERAAHDVLVNLRARGIIGWQRRCKPGIAFPWVQDTSAYFFKPPSEWIGYRPKEEAPPPAPETWGACPPLPAPLDAWSELRRLGAGAAAQIAALQADPSDPLAVALGGLRLAMAANPRDCRIGIESSTNFIAKRGDPQNPRV
jgi:hypothetical protein